MICITKVVDDNFDHAEFVSKLMDSINGPAYVVIDYHGFTEANGDQMFIFGSRNTSLVSNSSRSGYIVNDDKDKTEVVNFFTTRNSQELLLDWFTSHADICRFGDSNIHPMRLCAMSVILQPVEHGIPKYYA